jgi:LytS/YehU family sensor histidine kinase
MLMTLVENAVKHGVAPLGRGRIDVRLAREAGVIRAVVVDDGRGVPVAPGTGVGLANVRERLAALYGEQGSIALEPVAEGGARAVLVVPDEGNAANFPMTPTQASA